jgi:hypothetical protein
MKVTLEEIAANLADPNVCKTENWIAGAKWQAKQMYSEEDMRKAFKVGFSNGFASAGFASDIFSTEKLQKETERLFCEWFKQFKKSKK